MLEKLYLSIYYSWYHESKSCVPKSSSSSIEMLSGKLGVLMACQPFIVTMMRMESCIVSILLLNKDLVVP